MNQWKVCLALVLSLALVLAFTACSAPEQSSSQPSESASDVSSAASDSEPESSGEPVEAITIKIGALKGPTGMGMARLMEQSDAGATANTYQVELAGAPTDLVGKLTSGELDMAALPTNLAATLYQKTSGGVQLVTVNTLGVLYLLDTTGTVSTLADLGGKTLYATGQGSTPEYVLNYLLAQNGLTPGENVTVEYKSEHAELATLAVKGDAPIAMLPEPFVTSVTGKFTTDQRAFTSIDLTAEWEKATGGKQLAMSGIVVRRAFAEEHPEALAAFLKDYQASTEYTNANPAEAAKLIEQYEIMTAEVAQQAIPRCNIVFLEGEAMRDSTANYLQVIYDTDPKSVGGTLPDDGFYYRAG